MSWIIAIAWVGGGIWGYPDFCHWQREKFPDQEKELTPFKRDYQLLICMLIGPLIFLKSVINGSE